MAMQSADKDMKKINEGQFMAWLEQFDPMDIPNALPDILDFYQKQSKGTATAKK